MVRLSMAEICLIYSFSVLFFKAVGFLSYLFLPQHFLYFLPLPQGQGSLG